MRITLESTGQLVPIDGVACRVWEGTAAGGVAVTAFMARVSVPIEADASEFERELIEARAPASVAVITPAQSEVLAAALEFRRVIVAAKGHTFGPGNAGVLAAFNAARERFERLADGELARMRAPATSSRWAN